MVTPYRREFLPATGQIRDTFADVIASLGGEIPDVYNDGERLYARAVLLAEGEVRPGDRIRGGVAVRALGAEIQVHPYTFRKVCSNGAIAAHALETHRLERVESTEVFAPSYDVAVVLAELRSAVEACAAPEVFEKSTNEMRSAAEVQADVALQLLPAIARWPQHMAASVLPLIFQRFAADGDQSAFGLVNAVTSLARDTRDPETRWRLEELGGTIPARLRHRPRVGPTASALVQV